MNRARLRRRSRPLSRAARKRAPAGIVKVPTGIDGFDQITGGGLPRGRTTLVCGGAGCGKTLFAAEFLVNGATQHDEPGVFFAFEETAGELARNVASLGFDLPGLVARGVLAIDFVKIDRSEIEEAGAYDLEGLFVRLGHAIDTVGARRVVLDTLEALFNGFDDAGLLRDELRRLFRWLKDRRVTAIVTGERGDGTLTRYGLEEYVSDCVIALDNRVDEQLSTRRLRIVKYRGSSHGSNEYPFLIDERGLSVLPVTSLGLDYDVSDERAPTGIASLDDMLEGGGFYRGSSVLVSGTAGTGKTSMAGHFADATCRRRGRALYFAMEESSAQVTRNMRSIGIDLAAWQARGLLRIHAARPTVFGLEMHLVAMHRAVETFQPTAVIVDPISSLVTAGTPHEVKSMLTRLLDYLKMRGITCLATTLAPIEDTELGLSSLIDTWVQLRDLEIAGERTRGLYVVKSRGMGHSNQVREFVISSHGIELLPVTIGPGGVLTGSARVQLESVRRAQTALRQDEVARRERAVGHRRKALDAQISAMRAALDAEEEEAQALASSNHQREERALEVDAALARSRSTGTPDRSAS